MMMNHLVHLVLIEEFERQLELELEVEVDPMLAALMKERILRSCKYLVLANLKAK